MKNILITVISVLMTVLIIITMIKGLTIGNIKILSIADIKQNSMDLDKKIEDLNTLKNLTYKQKVGNLEDSTKRLTTAKQKYLEEKINTFNQTDYINNIYVAIESEDYYEDYKNLSKEELKKYFEKAGLEIEE